jgi:hypothetical protein
MKNPKPFKKTILSNPSNPSNPSKPHSTKKIHPLIPSLTKFTKNEILFKNPSFPLNKPKLTPMAHQIKMLGNYNSSQKSQSTSPSPGKLVPSDFKEWESQNMYRSWYRDMHKTSPVKNKNYAIPGYTGHIPGASADTNYGKRFAALTREQFCRKKYLPERITEKFPQRPENVSTMTTPSSKFGGGLLDEFHSISRFHGKCTIPETHPNYTASDWTTNYTSTFVPQEPLRPTIFRKTDGEFWKNTPVLEKSLGKTSGFVQNSTLFDGKGWLPIEQLHGDMKGSEYRNRFNPDVDFHPSPLRANVRKMPEKKLVY